MTPAIHAAEKARVPFEILEYTHDPAAESFGHEAAEALGLDPAHVFKTLVVQSDRGQFAVGLVPVSATLDLKAMASAVGAKKVALADAAAAERVTGYVVGGISPLGQRRALRTIVDESAQALPRMYVSAGRRGLQIALAPADLLRLCRGEYGAIAR